MSIRAFAAILLAFVAVPLFALPTLEFDSDSVTVRGVTTGTSVAIVSVGRERRDYLDHFTKWDGVIADSDSDGVVTVTIAGGVLPRTVWYAVDLATGDFTTATPNEFGGAEIPFPLVIEGGGASGEPAQLTWEKTDMFVALVRPGVGVWVTQVFDGGDDAEAPNGTLSVSIAAMRELRPNGANAPSQLAEGDVIIGIDRLTLAAIAMRVED